MQTAVEWLKQQIDLACKIDKTYNPLPEEWYDKAKEMEDEKLYETKCFWFGRGVLAGRENMIDELKPKRENK